MFWINPKSKKKKIKFQIGTPDNCNITSTIKKPKHNAIFVKYLTYINDDTFILIKFIKFYTQIKKLNN